MRSEFEKLLKQHRDALTDELVKLGNHRQVQLVEWDIERNETDYEFYFDGAWNAQQSKVNELQKRLDGLTQVVEELLEEMKYPTATFEEVICSGVRELEQAIKGGSTPNLNTDENGECRHFSTTMFADGKAECFQCDAVVNGQREVIGKQSKDLHPFFKREPK